MYILAIATYNITFFDCQLNTNPLKCLNLRFTQQTISNLTISELFQFVSQHSHVNPKKPSNPSKLYQITHNCHCEQTNPSWPQSAVNRKSWKTHRHSRGHSRTLSDYIEAFNLKSKLPEISPELFYSNSLSFRDFLKQQQRKHAWILERVTKISMHLWASWKFESAWNIHSAPRYTRILVIITQSARERS